MKIKLDDGAYMPIRGHETDAGLDLRTPKPFWLYSGHYLKIDTGVHVAIHEGMVGLITSKSGLMAKQAVGFARAKPEDRHGGDNGNHKGKKKERRFSRWRCLRRRNRPKK